jgi:hypothetical protein
MGKLDDLRKALLRKGSPAVDKKDVQISSASMLHSKIRSLFSLCFADTFSSAGIARKFTPQEIFLLRNGIYAAAKGLSTEDWKNHFNAMDKSHRVGSGIFSGGSD